MWLSVKRRKLLSRRGLIRWALKRDGPILKEEKFKGFSCWPWRSKFLPYEDSQVQEMVNGIQEPRVILLWQLARKWEPESYSFKKMKASKTWMSLEDPKSQMKSEPRLTLWFQPGETLSRGPREFVSGLLTFENLWDNVLFCFKSLNLWYFVIQQ